MMYIHEVIESLLDEYRPVEIADTLGVTQAMISTWKKKEQDFTPRVSIAAKILSYYGIRVFPYDKNDLLEVAEREALQASRRY